MGGKVYDRHPLPLDRDPLKQLSTEVGKFKSTAELLAEQRKQMQDQNPVLRLLQLIAGTESGTPTLDQVVAGWANLHVQQLAKIHEATGIDLSSFPAFLASLHDGVGIDLPAIGSGLEAAQANLQGVIDRIHQAVNGGTTVNNAIATVKTNLLALKNAADTAFANAGTAISNAATAIFNAATADGKASTAQADLQTFVGNTVAAFTGAASAANAALSDALTATRQAYLTLSDHTVAIAELQARRFNNSVKGALFAINFGNYADGNMPADWTVTYTGSGVPKIGIVNGLACWRTVANADCDAKILYNSPTATPFQLLRGAMSVPPEPARAGGSAPKFHAIGRVSANGSSFVWARAYCSGFLQFTGEMGYTLNGVETVWASGIPLTWALDMTMKCGVGTNGRQYQVWSGNTLVKEWDERFVNGVSGTLNTARSLYDGDWTVTPSGPSTISYDGATTGSLATSAAAATIKSALDGLGKGTFYVNVVAGVWHINTPDPTKTLTMSAGAPTQQWPRKWGSIAQIRSGTLTYSVSGKVGGCSIADNPVVAVAGSVACMSRTSSGSVSYVGGSSETAIPGSFFDNIECESLDIDANTASGTFTVTESKPYTITARVQLSTAISAVGNLILQVYRSGSWVSLRYGVTCNTNDSTHALSAMWVEPLNAGEQVRLAYVRGGVTLNALTGESSGKKTFFTIAGQG